MKTSLVFLILVGFLLLPQPVFAHAFGQLYNLPVPFWMYTWGGAAAIIFSFIVIGYFFNRKKNRTSYPSYDISRFSLVKFLTNDKFLILAKGISIFLFLLTIITGLFGANDSYSNFNMTFFWIIFVLGFTYLTGLSGNIYAVISPIKVLLSSFSLNNERMIQYPHQLSYWPAFIFYFIFIWLELIGDVGPFELSLIITFYFLINTVGATLFGSRDWLRYGEFFNVFFRLIGKIAPIEYRNEKIYLRPPFVGILTGKPMKSFSLLLFILFMLSSTAYDGFRETTPWYRFYWTYIDAFIRPIFGEVSFMVVGALALLLSPFFFLAIYLVLIFLSKVLTRTTESTISLAFKFGYTLIPIAFVYNVAHYYTLVITQGQEIIRLISDPFGMGWNLFGTGNINNNFIPDANFTWHSQVVLLLLGHIAGVYLAHEVALSIFPTRSKALISQIPMLILMVVYTVIGLWILSQPITSGI